MMSLFLREPADLCGRERLREVVERKRAPQPFDRLGCHDFPVRNLRTQHCGLRVGSQSGASLRQATQGIRARLSTTEPCQECLTVESAAHAIACRAASRERRRGKVAPVPTEHAFPNEHVHFKWDAGNEPALVVASGDTVALETRDVSDNQLTPSSKSEDIERLDWDRVYPLAGPISVEGAEPGDTLAIEILELRVRDWGWTAIIPGLGLLPDDFPSPYLRGFDLADGESAFLREDVAIPIEPFFGTMGVCPSGAEEQAVMPPGTFGGNLDTRQLVQGATLYLPVEVEGARFSCGDAHAAQGDGEVCVTGIETPIGATLRLTLEKGRRIPAPQFRTPGPLTPRANRGEWYGTTGVGPDLYAAAQDAVRAMIKYVSATSGLSPEDAYVLASLCIDLKISEIVDAGQYVVSALLPLNVFAAP
jgi:acetamidase/formamidase